MASHVRYAGKDSQIFVLFVCCRWTIPYGYLFWQSGKRLYWLFVISTYGGEHSILKESYQIYIGYLHFFLES